MLISLIYLVFIGSEEMKMMSIEDKKSLIRRVLDELYNQRNLALIDEVATENVLVHTTSIDLKGREGWKQYATIFSMHFQTLT